MAAKIFMRVTAMGIEPENKTYAKMFNDLGMKAGQKIWCTITKPRNQKHHAKFFAWLHPAFESQDMFTDVERFRYWVIVTAGFYEEVIFDPPVTLTPQFIEALRKDGQNIFFMMIGNLCGGYRMAKSLKFAKMDQDEFAATYDAVCSTLMRNFNFNVDDWEKEEWQEAGNNNTFTR